MDKKHDNSPGNWSQEEQRANYLDHTIKFTTEDLERERLRLREESLERFRDRHSKQPLDGDYFDQGAYDNDSPATHETVTSKISSWFKKVTKSNDTKEEQWQEESPMYHDDEDLKAAYLSPSDDFEDEFEDDFEDDLSIYEADDVLEEERAFDKAANLAEESALVDEIAIEDDIVVEDDIAIEDENPLDEETPLEAASKSDDDVIEQDVALENDDIQEDEIIEESLEETTIVTPIIKTDKKQHKLYLNDEEHDRLVDQIADEIQDEPGPLVTDQAFNDTVQIPNFHQTFEEALEDHEFGEYDADVAESTDESRHFVGGATWLTIGNILSRVIGALYVIPWATWLGIEYTQANTLYSVGYKPYSLFLAVATAGFPSAIAKQMAYFHSKNEYRVADKLFKNSMLIMLVTGVISAVLLFFLAPILAVNSSTTNPDGAIFVIRSLVPALLILPAMSLLRGYFQGFNDMKPTAVSQVLEQLARVAYMLTATYAIMRVYDGTATTAVIHSTFAAFIGAMIALVYLLIVYLRHLSTIRAKIANSANNITVDFKDSIKLMLHDSVPFILLGSGIIIIQLIDTYTFSQILEQTSALLLGEISELYGVLSLDVDKLMMIIVSLAVSMATAAVPAVTRKYTSGDLAETGQLVNDITLIFAAVMLPAATGMAAIADNVYTFFYATGSLAGPALLVTGALSSIALGAYTVFSTILQSMNFRRAAVKFLIVAILIKVLLQYPLVALFHAHGALIGTMIAFIVSSILMWRKIEIVLVMDSKKLRRDMFVIIVVTIVMTLITILWNLLFNALFGPVGRAMTFVKIMLTIIIAAIVYIGGLGIFGRLSILIGDRFKALQDKLRLS